MTQVLSWAPIKEASGRQRHRPAGRSGHTITAMGPNVYMFGGLIEGASPAGPTDEMWLLTMSSTDAEWHPCPRKVHTDVAFVSKIFPFIMYYLSSPAPFSLSLSLSLSFRSVKMALLTVFPRNRSRGSSRKRRNVGILSSALYSSHTLSLHFLFPWKRRWMQTHLGVKSLPGLLLGGDTQGLTLGPTGTSVT